MCGNGKRGFEKAVIHIFTSVVNRPDFILLQDYLFKKYLEDEYTFHVVDDSTMNKEMETACRTVGARYYKKPSDTEELRSSDPSRACAIAVQWTYDNFIKYRVNDLVLFLDSDMFLVKDFNIKQYMSDAIIAGRPQYREHIYYLWNGLMFFNMPKLHDRDINFYDGYVDGILTDVGGETHNYFKRTQVPLKETDWRVVSKYKGIDLSEQEGYEMELHLEDKFLHFRSASNWFSDEWKKQGNPLTKKEELFNRIKERL